MRRSTSIRGPAFLLTSYYVFVLLLFYLVARYLPGLSEYLPFGGIEELVREDVSTFEIVSSAATAPTFDAIRLAIATVGTMLLMPPISWVYFITTRSRRIDRSFAQTIMVLPIVVAGIAVIVQHSIPLAFSLAGIVAAVRFRFSLNEPADALYIFVAIVIGLGAGIGALGVAMATSIAFVFIILVLWRLDYGDDLTTPFFSFLTGRGQDDNEL